MITTINDYKYILFESKSKALKALNSYLLIKEDNMREFEWDLNNDINDDIKLIDQLKLGKEKIGEYFKSLMDKIYSLPEKIQLRLFKGVVVAFVGLITLPQMLDTVSNYFSTKPAQNIETVNRFKDVVIRTYKKDPAFVKSADQEKKYVQPTDFSDTLIEFLKHEEGSIKDKGQPVLTAYNIGDGMITIGYGHAERVNKTKMRAGKTKITKDQAVDLLIEDIKEAQGQLDDILNSWKKEGINIKLTQGMYDSMISMVYNMGIGNFRKSEFIQLIKQGKFEKAKEKIKTTNVTYRGHVIRREKEAELFGINDVTKFDFRN